MIYSQLTQRSLSVVLLGDFNPKIFQPFWFAHKKLLSEQECKEASENGIEVIHSSIVRFKTTWANFDISQTRFEIRTSNEQMFNPAKDLLNGIFNILNETPIKAIGINHILHYRMSNKEVYHNFGVDKGALKNWSFMNNPKLLQIEIVESERTDGEKGSVRIRLYPSDLVKPNGIAVNINDHYDVADGSNGRQGEAMDLCNKYWNSSFDRAIEIANNI